MIHDIGKDEFESNPVYDDLKDIQPPPCFLFVFNVFIEIFNHSKEGITWQDVDAYIRCRDIFLKQSEIDSIMLCSKWATETICKLKDEEE